MCQLQHEFKLCVYVCVQTGMTLKKSLVDFNRFRSLVHVNCINKLCVCERALQLLFIECVKAAYVAFVIANMLLVCVCELN